MFLKKRALFSLSIGLLLSASSTIPTEAQTITYDGTNPALLVTDPINSLGKSLLPTTNTSGNTVSVTGGSITGRVYGGWSQAAGVTIQNNTVTITGGTISRRTYGGYSTSGDAVSNKLVINGGQLGISTDASNVANTYGGFSSAGNALNNQVLMQNGIVKHDLYGGFSQNQSSKANTVIMTGGTIERDIYGGQGAGLAENNFTQVSGGTVLRDAYGGYSSINNANSNKITISGTATIGSDVFGGYTASTTTRQAIFNQVFITGGTIGADVYGGYGQVNGSAHNVESNSVSFTNGNVTGSVYGGKTTGGNALSNQVFIGGTAIIQTNVYGGDSVIGTVSNNTVSLADSASITGNVIGGHNTSGAVNSNTIFSSGNVRIGGNIYGGQSLTSTASDNLLSLSGGTVGGNIYGGFSITDATTNTISSQGVTVTGDFYGGYSTTGSANSNTVTISGGSSGSIYGGSSIFTTGTANNNEILLDSTLINGSVYGGTTTDGSASSNKITIQNTTVTSEIYGGQGLGSTGASDGNTLTIINTTSGSIFGGQGNTSSSNNILLMADSKIQGDIYGGYGAVTSTDNSLTFSNSSASGTLYGNNNLSTTWQTDNNTLTIGTGNSSAGGVLHFQTSTINSDGSFNITASASGNTIFGDLTNDGFLSFYNDTTNQDIATIENNYSGTGVIGLEAILGENATTSSADSLIFKLSPVSPIRLTFNPLTGTTASNQGTFTKFAHIDDGNGTLASFTTVEPGYGVYAYEIRQVGDDFFIGLIDKHAPALGKPHSETAAAVLQQNSLSSDVLLFQGIDSSIAESQNNGVGIFANIGYADYTTSTGSSADLKGTSALVAIAFERKSPWAFGMFGEYFNGSYSTENDVTTGLGTFKITADGDLKSYGGGIFTQYRPTRKAGDFRPWAPGFHLKATARLGRSSSDFTSGINTYERKGNYYGGSLGGGYIFEVSKRLNLDLYTHGIWTRQSQNQLQDNLGQSIHFNTADSVRWINGVRAYIATKNEKVRPFIGIATDWEMAGQPQVTVNGYQAHQAKLTGLTGIGEVGIALYPTKESPYSLELSAQSLIGKREGFSVHFNGKFWF